MYAVGVPSMQELILLVICNTICSNETVTGMPTIIIQHYSEQKWMHNCMLSAIRDKLPEFASTNMSQIICLFSPLPNYII
jgi:hypothetical protein